MSGFDIEWQTFFGEHVYVYVTCKPEMSESSRITRQRDLQQTAGQGAWLDAALSRQLQAIISSCFSGIDSGAYLNKYFLRDDCFMRRLRLFYSGEQLVGYCLLTFARHRLAGTGRQGKSVVLMGASAGFLPDYRHGNHTLQFSLQQAIHYKLRHPLQTVYFADTMLSPAMYRVMAKAVGIIYPHPDKATPPDVVKLLQHLQPDSQSPGHVMFVGRKSQYSSTDLQRFAASDKAEIRFYLQTNPQFAEGYALLTVIPVSLWQMLLTGMRRLQKHCAA